MRPLRAVSLVTLGAVAGVAAAGAFLRRALPSLGDPGSDELSLVAVLNGVELKSSATAFRGGSILAWLGGVALDLREATLAPDARLVVHSLLGGVAIRVPPGWRLESNLHALLGGVSVAPAPADEDAPTLTLEGVAVLGGIAVGARAAPLSD